MRFPLGPVIARTFMSHLKMNQITTTSDYMKPWTRYVEDTITAIDPRKTQTALAKPNNFHHPIQFTQESEQKSKYKVFKCTTYSQQHKQAHNNLHKAKKLRHLHTLAGNTHQKV